MVLAFNAILLVWFVIWILCLVVLCFGGFGLVGGLWLVLVLVLFWFCFIVYYFVVLLHLFCFGGVLFWFWLCLSFVGLGCFGCFLFACGTFACVCFGCLFLVWVLGFGVWGLVVLQLGFD